jgi:hypothetical protein
MRANFTPQHTAKSHFDNRISLLIRIYVDKIFNPWIRGRVTVAFDEYRRSVRDTVSLNSLILCLLIFMIWVWLLKNDAASCGSGFTSHFEVCPAACLIYCKLHVSSNRWYSSLFRKNFIVFWMDLQNMFFHIHTVYSTVHTMIRVKCVPRLCLFRIH